MQVAALPKNEDLRIKNLLSYGILDSAEEKDFDDLAELIAQVCKCQFALITFIDSDRHWFKARRQVEIKRVQGKFHSVHIPFYRRMYGGE